MSQRTSIGIKDYRYKFVAKALFSIGITLFFLLFMIFNVKEPPNIVFFICISVLGLITSYQLSKIILGEYDLFEPLSMVFIILFYNVFLVPVFTFAFDMRTSSSLNFPEDYLWWMTYNVVLNLLAILFFAIGYKFMANHTIKSFFDNRRVFRDYRKTHYTFLMFALISLGFYFFVISLGAGIRGVDFGFEMGLSAWFFVFAEAFPVLLYMFIIIKNKFYNNTQCSKSAFYLRLLFFIILAFIFTGLRGSRSNFLFTVLWILMIGHIFEYKISKRLVFIIAIPALVFNFYYGIYKQIGLDVFQVFTGERTIEEISEQYPHRSVPSYLIGTFSRTRLHAFMLYRYHEYPERYSLGYGETYVGDTLRVLLPERFQPDLADKRDKGTELLYGAGDYQTYGPERSTRIYGIYGEALLNFGIIGIFAVFTLWGGVVAILTNIYKSAVRSKYLFVLFLPLVVRLVSMMYLYDWGNIVFQLIKNGLFPFMFLLFISYKHYSSTPQLQSTIK